MTGAIVIKSFATLFAIVAVGIIIVTAINAGIDGPVTLAGIAAIAGLGGYEIRNIAAIIEKARKP